MLGMINPPCLGTGTCFTPVHLYPSLCRSLPIVLVPLTLSHPLLLLPAVPLSLSLPANRAAASVSRLRRRRASPDVPCSCCSHCLVRVARSLAGQASARSAAAGTRALAVWPKLRLNWAGLCAQYRSKLTLQLANVLAKRARETDTETETERTDTETGAETSLLPVLFSETAKHVSLGDATTGVSCNCAGGGGGGSVEPASNTGFITITSRRHS